MSFEIQNRPSVGKQLDPLDLPHHPVNFLYSFSQKTLMKERVKEKGQKVFLPVQSLFPILSNQEVPHRTF